MCIWPHFNNCKLILVPVLTSLISRHETDVEGRHNSRDENAGTGRAYGTFSSCGKVSTLRSKLNSSSSQTTSRHQPHSQHVQHTNDIFRPIACWHPCLPLGCQDDWRNGGRRTHVLPFCLKRKNSDVNLRFGGELFSSLLLANVGIRARSHSDKLRITL